MRDFLLIREGDSVAVALKDLPKGAVYAPAGEDVELLEEIPRGHKFALTDIAEGEQVVKYGFPIGLATQAIKRGAWVHTHNVKTGLGDMLEYHYNRRAIELPKTESVTFNGYNRKNGTVGVRNELWVIPTVGCVGKVAQSIAGRAQHLVKDGIEAVAAFNHPFGCSQMGEDQDNFRRIIGDLINHSNAGGVLVLGLGCENSGIDELMPYIDMTDDKRIRFLVCQESDDEIADGLKLLEELAAYAGTFRREPVSCAELIVGMKCGGSDGLSGITANPVVGGFSDLLISKGGTTILTEVPEMFGAETLLMDRCDTPELFQSTVSLINDFKAYFTSYNQTIYENPSPGNKKGGITTLEDKSLGCTQKSGSAPVRGVLSYGERVTESGLNLLSAPGNDLVASTALAAAGAHIVLFTTGRGTPFSCPVPTVKISSNSALSERKNNWIDFDAGHIVDGLPLNDCAMELFDYVIRVASGEPVKSEQDGYRDLAIFKQGVTL